MSEFETNMASFSRYVEMKYRDYHNLGDSYLYSLGILPHLSDMIVYLSIVDYVRDFGIDKYITNVYDESIILVPTSVMIESGRETRRKKRSIWRQYKSYLGIPNEFTDEELIKKFTPLAPYVNQHIRSYDYQNYVDIWREFTQEETIWSKMRNVRKYKTTFEFNLSHFEEER